MPNTTHGSAFCLPKATTGFPGLIGSIERRTGEAQQVICDFHATVADRREPRPSPVVAPKAEPIRVGCVSGEP